jgi:hypothetical protein
MLSFANHANTLAMSMGRSPTDRSLDRQINSRNVSLFRRPDDNPQAIRLPGRRSSGLCQPLAAGASLAAGAFLADRRAVKMLAAPLARLVPGLEFHRLDVRLGHDEMVANATHAQDGHRHPPWPQSSSASRFTAWSRRVQGTATD